MQMVTALSVSFHANYQDIHFTHKLNMMDYIVYNEEY